MKTISVATCSQARSRSWAQSQSSSCSADLRDFKTIPQLEYILSGYRCYVDSLNLIAFRQDLKSDFGKTGIRLCWYKTGIIVLVCLCIW